MRIKGLTFGTLFLFLVVNSFSQAQQPQKPTTTGTQPQKPTTTSTQTQKPATTTSTPQRVTPAAAGTQTQRTVPAAAAAAEAEARRATDDATVDGADLHELHLMPPERGGGRPFMEVLNERRSTREFSHRELEPHIMSNLLWAANGVNRREDIADGEAGNTTTLGKRTAPSARDAKEIDIYILTEKGVYLYLPDNHTAKNIKNGDFRREVLGKSTFAYEAPLVLVYVANAKKMEKFDMATRDIYAAVDCGFISQNVYLYCASEQLATVVLGNFSKEAATKVLGLKNDKALFAQPVGHRD